MNMQAHTATTERRAQPSPSFALPQPSPRSLDVLRKEMHALRLENALLRAELALRVTVTV